MKKGLVVLVVLAVIIAAVVVWFSGNVDGLVRDAIVKHGSAMTQTKVSVAAVEIAAASGSGIVKNLVVANPAGFASPHLISIGQIEIALDLASVTRDTVLIHRIVLDAPDIIYEQGAGMTNIEAIMKNLARDGANAAAAGEQGGTEQNGKAQGGVKLIIETLTISNATAQVSAPFMNGKALSVPLPTITLKDLGKAQGGITPGEFGQAVAQALQAELRAAASFDQLKKSAGDVLNKAGSALQGLFK